MSSYVKMEDESLSYSTGYEDINYTCPKTGQVDPWHLSVGISFQLIFVIGVIGNGTVLYVIAKYAKMKTVTNWYIFNLALSDMLFLTSIPLQSLAIIFECWPFGKVMCHVTYILDNLNMYTGINCLVVMSVDRFIAVCCPLKASKYRNPRTALVVNISVWVVSLICSIPNIIMIEYSTVENLYCTLNYERLGPGHIIPTVHIIYMAMIGFFVPLVVIAICYTRIVIKLRIVSAKTGKMEKSRKVNRLVLGVVLVFIACWGPFYTLRFILAIHPELSRFFRHGIRYLFNITLIIGYVNSCANCFLYAFLSESFKKSFQAAWFCSRSRDINSDLTNSSGYVLRGGRRERMRKEIDRLTCFRKWSKLKTTTGEQFDDDNYLSGTQHNSYPLTSMTTAVSDACRAQE